MREKPQKCLINSWLDCRRRSSPLCPQTVASRHRRKPLLFPTARRFARAFPPIHVPFLLLQKRLFHTHIHLLDCNTWPLVLRRSFKTGKVADPGFPGNTPWTGSLTFPSMFPSFPSHNPGRLRVKEAVSCPGTLLLLPLWSAPAPGL